MRCIAGIRKRGITYNINMKSLHFFVTNNAYPKRVQAKAINSWKPTSQQGVLSEHIGTHLMHFNCGVGSRSFSVTDSVMTLVGLIRTLTLIDI